MGAVKTTQQILLGNTTLEGKESTNRDEVAKLEMKNTRRSSQKSASKKSVQKKSPIKYSDKGEEAQDTDTAVGDKSKEVFGVFSTKVNSGMFEESLTIDGDTRTPVVDTVKSIEART